MIIVASLLMGLAFGETFDVYVSPIRFVDQTTTGAVSINHDSEAPFHYSSMYARTAKASNGKGGYHELHRAFDEIRVYNSNSIEIAYDNCDYLYTPLKCSVFNQHHYVETTITFSNDQLVIRTSLYNENGTMINTSARTDKMGIKWIKQQETSVIDTRGPLGSATIVNKPKEELPLKWEIPYRLFERDVQQALLGLWMGVKIN
jgi:hypothetical protein